jgi:MoxR-like ATPase
MDTCSDSIKAIKENIGKAIIGKEDVIELLLTAVICQGHILIEDVPGVGKTTLAKALAKSIGCDFKRVQFTPDLLPADLTRINFYSQKTSEFILKKGPVFTNILLADEINRATPRTQSSLLECMEERQVTADGETKRLDTPFIVLATQNPVENFSTFPLPEAQLDRFLMKIGMGYPDMQEEKRILKLTDNPVPPEALEPVLDRGDILRMQSEFNKVVVNEDIEEYILNITAATRGNEAIELGVSPRGSIALYRAAKAYAYVKGRAYVLPDDAAYLAPFVLSHRITARRIGRHGSRGAADMIKDIVKSIEPPLENK